MIVSLQKPTRFDFYNKNFFTLELVNSSYTFHLFTLKLYTALIYGGNHILLNITSTSTAESY